MFVFAFHYKGGVPKEEVESPKVKLTENKGSTTELNNETSSVSSHNTNDVPTSSQASTSQRVTPSTTSPATLNLRRTSQRRRLYNPNRAPLLAESAEDDQRGAAEVLHGAQFVVPTTSSGLRRRRLINSLQRGSNLRQSFRERESHNSRQSQSLLVSHAGTLATSAPAVDPVVFEQLRGMGFSEGHVRRGMQANPYHATSDQSRYIQRVINWMLENDEAEDADDANEESNQIEEEEINDEESGGNSERDSLLLLVSIESINNIRHHLLSMEYQDESPYFITMNFC